MLCKTSFWTPISTSYCLYPPIMTLFYLFGPHGTEDSRGEPTNSEGATIAETIPGFLRPFYYTIAAAAVLAVSLISSGCFLLITPITVMHDAIVKLGEPSGCCEMESQGTSLSN